MNEMVDRQTGELINGEHAEYWAEVVREDWRKTLQGVMDAGLHLIEAQEELSHGEWGKLTGRTEGYKPMLPFGWRTASMLMSIVQCPQLSNVQHVTHLPASWGTLYQLTTLNTDDKEQDAIFEYGINEGYINPGMQQKVTKPNRIRVTYQLNPGTNPADAATKIREKFRADIQVINLLDEVEQRKHGGDRSKIDNVQLDDTPTGNSKEAGGRWFAGFAYAGIREKLLHCLTLSQPW